MAANHAAAMQGRAALVAPEELRRDQAFVQGGFGVNPAAAGAVTRRVQRERVSPEEEVKRYLGREERGSREDHRERREREKRGRFGRFEGGL